MILGGEDQVDDEDRGEGKRDPEKEDLDGEGLREPGWMSKDGVKGVASVNSTGKLFWHYGRE